MFFKNAFRKMREILQRLISQNTEDWGSNPVRDLIKALDLTMFAPAGSGLRMLGDPTRTLQVFWGELADEHREVAIRIMMKRHNRIANAIRAASDDELVPLQTYFNQVLERQAVLVATYPKFRDTAVDLKDIILTGVGDRINKNQAGEAA